MKGMGMLVVSLSGVNFGFWSHVGCSVKNAIIFSRERLVQGCTRKNIKLYIYTVCFLTWSLLGVKKNLSHTQIGLLQGFNSKFPTSILTPFICGVPPPPEGSIFEKEGSDKSTFWKGVLLHSRCHGKLFVYFEWRSTYSVKWSLPRDLKQWKIKLSSQKWSRSPARVEVVVFL